LNFNYIYRTNATLCATSLLNVHTPSKLKVGRVRNSGTHVFKTILVIYLNIFIKFEWISTFLLMRQIVVTGFKNRLYEVKNSFYSKLFLRSRQRRDLSMIQSYNYIVYLFVIRHPVYFVNTVKSAYIIRNSSGPCKYVPYNRSSL